MTEDQQMAFAIQMSLGSQQGVNDYICTVFAYTVHVHTYIHMYMYVQACVDMQFCRGGVSCVGTLRFKYCSCLFLYFCS